MVCRIIPLENDEMVYWMVRLENVNMRCSQLQTPSPKACHDEHISHLSALELVVRAEKSPASAASAKKRTKLGMPHQLADSAFSLRVQL